MIAFIAFSTLFTVAFAQWGGGHNQGYQQAPQQQYQQPPQQYQQPPQQYQQQPPQQYQQPPQQSYQAPAQPAYQPPAQPSRTYNPAPVHYVNIGAELAGDYKFGYDTGKGQDGQSFREETRLPDGSVQGAYGYVDDTGKQRIIRYTAGKNGYQVEGDGIPKAPAAPQQQQPQQQQQYAPPSNNNYNGQGGRY